MCYNKDNCEKYEVSSMKQNHPHPALADIPWESSLCLTGHRPEKLPGGEVLKGLTAALQYYIWRSLRLGYTHYLTGLADGVDYIASAYLFRLREYNPWLCVIGVQPCEDYEQFFRCRGYSLPHLHHMQENVDRQIVLPGSAKDKGIFLRRDRLMAEHCSGILAVCEDGHSGSMYTLSYAKSLGLSYCRLYPTPTSGIIPAPQDWHIEQCGFFR